MTIEIAKVEDGAVLNQRLDTLLEEHAVGIGTAFDPQTVGFEARASDGAFLGGLYGWGQLGWFFVKSLALEPGARKAGVGGRLIARVEEHAREAGLAGVYLDTYAFQAPGFYAKMGYTEIGRLPAAGDHPQRIWFAKTFDQ